jgi:hypothetical protein
VAREARPEPQREAARETGRVIFTTHPLAGGASAHRELDPWSVTWLLERGHDEP